MNSTESPLAVGRVSQALPAAPAPPSYCKCSPGCRTTCNTEPLLCPHPSVPSSGEEGPQRLQVTPSTIWTSPHSFRVQVSPILPTPPLSPYYTVLSLPRMRPEFTILPPFPTEAVLPKWTPVSSLLLPFRSFSVWPPG